MTRTNDAPVMVGQALDEALYLAVCTLAFHGRDRGTDRQERMLDDLEELARKVDPMIRDARHRLAALARPHSAVAPAGNAFADAGKPIAPAGDGVAGKRQAIEACACIADRIRDEFAAQATDTGGVFDENDYAAVAVGKVATSIRALSADEMEAHPLGAPWHARQPIEDMAKTWRGRPWVPLEAAIAALQFWQRRDYEHSIAALARPHSAVAPAGDGVVDRRYALEWRNEHTGGEWKRIGGGFDVPGNRHSSRHLTDREEAMQEMAKANARWVDGTDHRVVMIEETPVGFATDKGHHVVTEPAALARPRAAVGHDRGAKSRLSVIARGRTIKDAYHPSTFPDPVDAFWRDVLALQSPPAKVEGA